MDAYTHLLLTTSPLDLAEATGPTERGSVGVFQGQLQAADNWCWAAAAASVHATHLAASGGQSAPPTQCGIVDANLVGVGRACKDNAPGTACATVKEPGSRLSCVNEEMDREGFLHLALRKLDLLEGYVVLGAGGSLSVPGVLSATGLPLVVSDALDFDELVALVDSRRMVCLRIARGDYRHFVIVYGYEAFPDNDLLIWNPAAGPEVVDFEGFWREFGPFTHKIITRPLQ